MTIKEIYNSGEISVRSFNVCYNNGLRDLSALLNHFQEFRTFDNLRNCGNKSNKELINFCLKHIAYSNNRFDDSKVESVIVSTVKNLTRTQREIVNSFIEINVFHLSNRSRNAIGAFLNGNFKIQNINEKILSKKGVDYYDIKNVGTKSVSELKSFITSIVEFISIVLEIDTEKALIKLRNKFFIEKTFSISLIPDDILESQSIFKLVSFLIEKDVLFESKENIIFRNTFKIYSGQPEIIIEDIIERINLTKERIRQIRKNILENLSTSFRFIKNFEDDLYQKYEFDQNRDIIFIDDELNDLINQKNVTNFSNSFNAFIIYCYISDKFDLLGLPEDILLPKYFNSRGRHNWVNFYLINKKISLLFNFNHFVDDINRRLSERIEDSYGFNFKSYLLNFSTTPSYDNVAAVTDAAEKILNNEFGIYIDIHENIEFTRNSFKHAFEYAYEALNSLGKPAKVNDIKKKIEELHPTYETTDAKVRASMIRNNAFVPIGRRSIFGLREWESKIENFKGGTIRKIVSEYLATESDPKHISDIANYLLKFRPNTYEKSILDNLKADETRTFIFFKNSTVGLYSKKYDKSFVETNIIKSVEIKSWNDRYIDLSKFISTNNRLPLSSGYPNDEAKLYRWFKVQERNMKNLKLDNEKIKLLKQLTSQISNKQLNSMIKSEILEMDFKEN